MPSTPANGLLTAKDLACRLRVQTQTVRLWARTGVIPCIRVTRRKVLFDWDEVKQSLKARK